jgi:multiple sugar transport system permease protein
MTPPGRADQRYRHPLWRRLQPYGLLIPLLVAWGATIAYPLVRVVILSFTNSSPLIHPERFVGLANFTEIFTGGSTGGSTRTAVLFTLVFALACTTIELTFGSAIAILLSRRGRHTRLLGVIMIPWAISEIVTATAANWLFNAKFGMVDAIFRLVGLPQVVWLSSPTLARVAIIVMNSWEFMPLACLFILTGLTTVPADLIDQAKVDGATEPRIYRHVHWPIVKPVFAGIGTFITAINLVAFALPYAMTNGGPGTATYLLSYQVYELAIPGLQYGGGAALGVVTLILVLIIAAVGGFIVRRADRKLS